MKDRWGSSRLRKEFDKDLEPSWEVFQRHLCRKRYIAGKGLKRRNLLGKGPLGGSLGLLAKWEVESPGVCSTREFCDKISKIR